MGILDYSETPANNTSIGGSGIAGGSSIRAGDNVIRQMASDIYTDPRLASICDARLTLTSGTAVTTSDVTAAGTLYLTPYNGETVMLYDGSSLWIPHTLTELSIALSGGTASKPHDVFLDYNAGTPALAITAWTNDTTRATALTTQDGVYVQTGNTDWRYVGTIYLNGSKQCADAKAGRYVWNMYNRKYRRLHALSNDSSWTYTTAAYRLFNNSAAHQLNFVVGLDENAVDAHVVMAAYNSSANVGIYTGIGLDSTTTVATDCTEHWMQTTVANYYNLLRSDFVGLTGVGKHYLGGLEYSAATGTTTWTPIDSSKPIMYGGIWA